MREAVKKGVKMVTTDLAAYPARRVRELNPDNILPHIGYGFQSFLASFDFVRDFALSAHLISPLVHRLGQLGISIDFNARANPATLSVRRGHQIIAHS